MGFIVALVGAPNVGKSTLFNRLIRRKKAVVDDQPGVTRDRNYQELSWEGKSLTLVDTGGFEWDHHSPLGEGMQEQIEVALEEADLIVFVGDGRVGLTPTDEMVVERLRRTAKPVIYTVNKIDHAGREDILGEFYRLGIENLLPVSALHGLGMGELEEQIARHIPEVEEVPSSEEVLSLAVIGRPNVGKSSLVNALLGVDRVMVSPVPGPPATPSIPLLSSRGRNTCSSIRPVFGARPASRSVWKNTASWKPLKPWTAAIWRLSCWTPRIRSPNRTPGSPDWPLKRVAPAWWGSTSGT